MSVAPDCPLLHEYVNPLPPLAVTVALPFEPPLQLTAEIEVESVGFGLIVKYEVFVSTSLPAPFEAVRVTAYVPADA